MNWGGKKIYEPLHSGSNEYNEILLQRFSTSDNHDELGCNLMLLSHMGLNPYLLFSDDPERDESLVEKHFSNLRCDECHVSEFIEEIMPDNLQSVQVRGGIKYVHSITEVLSALSTFCEEIEAALDNNDIVRDTVKTSFYTGKWKGIL